MSASIVGSRIFFVRLLLRNNAASLPHARTCSSKSDGSGDAPDKEAARARLDKLLSEIKASKLKEQQETKEEEVEPRLAKPAFRGKRKVETSAVQDVSGMDSEMVHAAHLAASAVASTSDVDKRHLKVQKTESDLLKKLKSIAEETEVNKASAREGRLPITSLSSLFSSMEIEKEEKQGAAKRPTYEKPTLTDEQLAFLEKRQRMRRKTRALEQEEKFVPTDIFGSEPPFGIFTPKAVADENPNELSTWKKCREREIRILSTLPPRNFLEEMAQMTERGILWHFPIDNEQGINEEEVEPFHEHVFLEHHLEPWCPRKGPLRHFMELICVALSKNPHISAKKKVEHILWYRDYFEDQERKDILAVSGALQS